LTLPLPATRLDMLIEFDPRKRSWTLAQRGLDFVRSVDIFEGSTFNWIDSRVDYGEERIFTFGKLDGRYVVVVWTRRGEARRIISMRYANAREIAKHAHRVD
jgi:uncharacterized DUF497 family protein